MIAYSNVGIPEGKELKELFKKLKNFNQNYISVLYIQLRSIYKEVVDKYHCMAANRIFKNPN